MISRASFRPLAVLLLLALAAPPVFADTASEADLQFALGSELYKQRKYEEALQHFIASNRLVANRNVVFNIASIYGLLHRDTDAYNWYETYLGFEGLDAAAHDRGAKAQAALAAKVAVIDVSTTPPGAELFVDRTDLGSVGLAPRKIAVSAGDRAVIARLAGSHEAKQAVTVAQGTVASLKLGLTAIVGVLVVESEPKGSTVRKEDGSVLGVTPLNVTLPVGELRLSIVHEGFAELTRTVTVRDGADARVEVTLAKTVDRFSVLTVQGEPSGATVSMGGKPLGVVPLSVPGLEPGSYDVTISSPEHESFQSKVLFEPGAATRVDVKLVSSATLGAKKLKWLGYGLGAAALAAGIIVGVLAATTRASFFDSPSREAFDNVGRENNVADGLMLGGAIVLAGTLLVDLIVLRTLHTTGEAHVVR